MSYKDLTVWQKSMVLTVDIYALTKLYPSEEIYGLVSQMRRSAVSIPSNIAEGSRRVGKDSLHFLRIAYGSGSELETQLELSQRIGYITEVQFVEVNQLMEQVMKMLNVMINK